MPDSSYQPRTYRKQGDDEFVVAAGGKIVIEPGGAIVGGDGIQAGPIAAPAGGATTDAESRAAITSIIAALEAAGIIAAN